MLIALPARPSIRGAAAAGRPTIAPRRGRVRGFTLIALIVPNLFSSLDDARGTAARTDINTLVQALKRYRLDNQRYPSTEQGLNALVARPTAGVVPPNWKPYLDKLPADPWGRPYQFLSPGVRGEIDVFSFGADGAAGGEGKDADIGNWQ
jgi:general secretion pathway protein G